MKSEEVIENSLVWDNHACMPLRPDDSRFLPQLARHKSAGVDVVSLNVTFDAVATDPLLGFRMLAAFRSYIRSHDQDYLLIGSLEDIQRARQENKLGVFFDIEGGAAVESDPQLIQVYYDLGVRWMLIAYNQANKLGGGCQDEQDIGLTEFGRQVIDEMERVGMVLCCTHTGQRTALEAIQHSNNPVILSHSNPRAVHEHERNVSNDLLKAIGDSGGVVCLKGIGLFMGKDNDVSTKTFVRHLNYVAELIGPEHVGIGLDYLIETQELDDYVRMHPEMFPAEKGYQAGIAMIEPERIPAIADALLADGWSDTDLLGILGENNLRVAREVWK